MSNTENKLQTVAEQIWDEIKNKDMSLFALPAKQVSDYCKYVAIDPSHCFVIPQMGAVLPALEEIVGAGLKCEMMRQYIVISRVI